VLPTRYICCASCISYITDYLCCHKKETCSVQVKQLTRPCKLWVRTRDYQDNQLKFSSYTKSCLPSPPTAVTRKEWKCKEERWQTLAVSIQKKPTQKTLLPLPQTHKTLLYLFSSFSIPSKLMINKNYLLQRILSPHPSSSSFSMHCHFHKAPTMKNCQLSEEKFGGWFFF